MRCLASYVFALCLALLALDGARGPLSAQENTRAELTLPYGRVQTLASPDGARTLYGVPFQDGRNDGPQLWIKDNSTDIRKLLLSLGGTMQAFWSALPTGLVTVLDVHGTVNPASPFAAAQVGFQQTLAQLLASGGQAAVVQNYHTTVAPFCAAAARGFFSQF